MVLLMAEIGLLSACHIPESATDQRHEGIATPTDYPGKKFLFELQEGHTAHEMEAVVVRVNGDEVFFGYVTTNQLTGLAGRFTLAAAPERAELVVRILDLRGATATMVKKTLLNREGAFVGIARNPQGLVIRQQERPFLYD